MLDCVYTVTSNKHLQLRLALIWWLCRSCWLCLRVCTCVCVPSNPLLFAELPQTATLLTLQRQTSAQRRGGEVWRAEALPKTTALPFSKASLHLCSTCQLLPAVGCRGSRITNACTRPIRLHKAPSQSPISHPKLCKRTRRPCKGSGEGRRVHLCPQCAISVIFKAPFVSTTGVEAGLGCLTQCLPTWLE